MLEMIENSNIREKNKTFATYKCECGEVIKLRKDRANKERFYCNTCSRKIGILTRYKDKSISKSPEHSVWRGIKSRCYNPNTEHYDCYGGRGIKMSDEWKYDFSNFYRDMGPRPSSKHEIERIDNNGNYCVENCKWVTHQEELNNKRNNVFLEFNGKKQTVAMWEREIGVSKGVIYGRIFRYGWSVEKALTIPLNSITGRKSKEITYDGKTQTLVMWSKELNISRGVLYNRIFDLKWSIEKAFNKT